MSNWNDEEHVSNTSHRGKRRAHCIESSSSDSDSDSHQVQSIKRKKRPVLESDSESTSSSDSSSLFNGRNIRKRNKMPREDSDDSSSEESDDSTVRVRRGRVAKIESDDESTDASQSSDVEEAVSESGMSSGESSESSESYLSDDEVMIQAAIQESLASVVQAKETRENENKSKSTAPTATAPTASTSAGFASDSSDGQSEKCPICLLNFTDQEVGTPETCDHTFCAVCIQEWAKNVNTCPVDRQVFSLILIRKCLNGKVIKKIPVENREARDIPDESDTDPTFCEICGRCDREDRMLLCDGCDLGYHLECLDPPLDNVPVDEWFCPECSSDGSQMAEVVEIEDGEVNDLLDDLVHIRPRTSRLLPRTRQSERVRATIRSLHQERLRRRHNEPALQVLYDDGSWQFSYTHWDDSD